MNLLNNLVMVNSRTFFIAFFLFMVTVSQTIGQTNSPCVFCDIANKNKQESQVVYRDNLVVAFMSRGPRNSGHVLVVPRTHAKELTEVPDSTARQMISIAREIALTIRKTNIKCEAFQFQINSGEAAGQTVFHSHLHVKPRYKGDEVNEGKAVSNEELDTIAKKIREALNKQ